MHKNNAAILFEHFIFTDFDFYSVAKITLKFHHTKSIFGHLNNIHGQKWLKNS